MARSRPSIAILVLLAAAAIGPVASAKPSSAPAAVASRFAATLSSQGAAEITDNPDVCTSDRRPLRVADEMASMLARALEGAAELRLKAECERPVAGKDARTCRFFFFSPKKSEPWTVGLMFLGNPDEGSLKPESIRCFSTP